jgi:two-component system LytT family response regulator
LKPIDPDELTGALGKFRESGINENDKYQFLNDRLKNHNKPNERLALHSQDKIQIVEITTILRCESSVNYTTFFFQDGDQIVVTRTLKEFGDLLSEQGFFRVHQSHLVNTKHIKEYVKSDGGHLIMNDGNLIPVSVRKRPEVMKMLDSL